MAGRLAAEAQQAEDEAVATAAAAAAAPPSPTCSSSLSSPGRGGNAELAEAVTEARALREQLASSWEELAVAAAGAAQLRRQLREAAVREAASLEAGGLAAGTRQEEAMAWSERLAGQMLEIRQLSGDLEATRCELEATRYELQRAERELEAARSELEAARSEAEVARLEAG